MTREGDLISRQAVMNCIDRYSQMIIRPNELKEYIDKLPPVNPQPCEDAINRQAAISKIKELFSLGDCYCDEHSIIGTLNEMSSVNPQEPCDKCEVGNPCLYCKHEFESKIGHWIIKDGKEQGYDIGGIKTWYIQIMCDKCGFIKTAIEGHIGQYNYCPNCGCCIVGHRKVR